MQTAISHQQVHEVSKETYNNEKNNENKNNK